MVTLCLDVLGIPGAARSHRQMATASLFDQPPWLMNYCMTGTLPPATATTIHSIDLRGGPAFGLANSSDFGGTMEAEPRGGSRIHFTHQA